MTGSSCYRGGLCVLFAVVLALCQPSQCQAGTAGRHQPSPPPKPARSRVAQLMHDFARTLRHKMNDKNFYVVSILFIFFLYFAGFFIRTSCCLEKSVSCEENELLSPPPPPPPPADKRTLTCSETTGRIKPGDLPYPIHPNRNLTINDGCSN